MKQGLLEKKYVNISWTYRDCNGGRWVFVLQATASVLMAKIVCTMCEQLNEARLYESKYLCTIGWLHQQQQQQQQNNEDNDYEDDDDDTIARHKHKIK